MVYIPDAKEFWKWYDEHEYDTFSSEDLRLLDHLIIRMNNMIGTRIQLSFYIY